MAVRFRWTEDRKFIEKGSLLLDKDGGASGSADAEITQVRVMIDDIEFRIFVPKPKAHSAALRTPYEVVILERCGFEDCQRIIGIGGSLKRFCNDECKNAHHNLLRKFTEHLRNN
jgi:hypothetical protein